MKRFATVMIAGMLLFAACGVKAPELDTDREVADYCVALLIESDYKQAYGLLEESFADMVGARRDFKEIWTLEDDWRGAEVQGPVYNNLGPGLDTWCYRLVKDGRTLLPGMVIRDGRLYTYLVAEQPEKMQLFLEALAAGDYAAAAAYSVHTEGEIRDKWQKVTGGAGELQGYTIPWYVWGIDTNVRGCYMAFENGVAYFEWWTVWAFSQTDLDTVDSFKVDWLPPEMWILWREADESGKILVEVNV